MKGEYNVKKSETIKSCKVSLQKKNNKNKNYNIDLYSDEDQTDCESDDWERFSDFVDSG